MFTNIISLLLMAVAFTNKLSTARNTDDFLPCEIKWVEVDFLDALPPKSVRAGKSQYIIRAQYSGGTYRVGRLDAETGKGYIQAKVYQSFEVLTNPNNCRLSWKKPKRNGLPDMSKDYLIEFSPTAYVGRTVIEEDWRPGTVMEGRTYIETDVYHLHLFLFFGFRLYMGWGQSNDYQVLVTQSPGFQVEVFDFVFDNDAFGDGIDFMGLDNIYNRSPVEVSQSVTHTKTVTESMSVTESNSYSHTAGASVSASFFGVTASAHYEFTSTSSNSKTVSSEKSTTITLTREISVPPLTSIEACSTLKMAENFVLQYTAKARFKLDGMTGAQISNIFKKYDVPYVIDIEEENSVIGTMTGKFTGTLAMSTEFIVIPADSVTGCAELQKSIETYKRVKKSAASSIQDVNGAMQTVRRMMSQITGRKGGMRVSNATNSKPEVENLIRSSLKMNVDTVKVAG